MPTIRIEDEVFEALKKLAEPFVDTPSSVIRRLLEEKGALESREHRARRPTSDGGLTPQATYEAFLLATLEEKFGGRAGKRAVTQEVIARMSKRGFVTAADLEFVSTGETKAENTISWARNALKDRGLVDSASPRGIWQLTPAGREAARSTELPAASRPSVRNSARRP